jgi:hypothetical protein
MSEEQDDKVVEDNDDLVIEKVLWVEEEGGAKYALGEQLIDTQLRDDGTVVQVPSGIEVIAIDELLGPDGEVGGDFKVYAKPVDPASPLTQQGLGLALYLPRRRVNKWASVGPLAEMMKAREEAMQVQGADDDDDDDDEVEGEVSDGGEEGHTAEHGTHLGDADAQGAADAQAAPAQTGGAQPVGGSGAVDPGSVPAGSGG